MLYLETSHKFSNNDVCQMIFRQLKKKDGLLHYFFCSLNFKNDLPMLEEAIDKLPGLGYEIVDVKLAMQGDISSRVYITVTYR